jgi:hypothetical protein
VAVQGPKEIRHIKVLRALLKGRCDCDILRDRAAGAGYQAQGKRRPIKFQPTDHTLNNSYCAALLAALAYKTQAEIERELVEYGYLQWKVWFLKTPLASAFVTEWDDTLVVAFKGSSTAREWLNNANVRLKRTAYGGIHAGFYHAIMQIGPPLLRLILPGLLSGSKVIVTGHSRGGVLATLFVFLLAINGFRVGGLYSFGSPKPGDAEFANHWRSESEQYSVRARWMPSLVAFPITLLSTLAYLLWTLALVPLKFRMRRTLRKVWRGGKSEADDLRFTPVKDHFISSYLQSLLAEVEWRTKVSMIYYKVIERAISSSQLTATDIARKEYASMTRIAEQLVASPDAIEQFCERHGLLDDSVAEWISDYRTFTLTKEIKRRDQFFKEIHNSRDIIRFSARVPDEPLV